ncbi:hypothetical protein DV711_08895 [Motiliproteus coralliicola]|uniref:Uncharacterized protein n=1 Tax=Motiliproteus coralliicola TaxID=2283196 RepID=A0A369WLY6_9GAMM|nr:hypothetical protein DV711_08895 [Motiliproteus coralliicola]
MYEALPYLYIAIGVALFMLLGSPLVSVSAACLYAAGAIVWVTRSSYRRKNSRHQVENRKNRWLFPEQIYEYLPFIYMAVGIATLSHIPGIYGAIPGAVLCLAGALVWIIRAIYRSHPVPAG